MLSTFFSTSKPIHYLVIALIVILSLTALIFLNPATDWTFYFLIIPVIFALGLGQFIVFKNELTNSNTYAVFLFALFLLIALSFEIHWKSLATLVLVLLALRRLLSLRTGKDYIKKIFDASFWITISCLIESCSSLFFITIYVSIFLFARHQFRYWFVPIIASLSVIIIAFTLDQFVSWNLFQYIKDGWQLDFLWNYDAIELSMFPVICIAVMTAIAIVIYFVQFTRLQKSERPRQIVLIITAVTIGTLFFISFETFLKHGVLWIALIPAIFMARLVQKISSQLWKELMLWFPVILLVITFMIS